MKKVLLFVAISFSGLLFSCNKCVTCTHISLPDEEICRKDFDTEEQYQTAIDVLEFYGDYNCK